MSTLPVGSKRVIMVDINDDEMTPSNTSVDSSIHSDALTVNDSINTEYSNSINNPVSQMQPLLRQNAVSMNYSSITPNHPNNKISFHEFTDTNTYVTLQMRNDKSRAYSMDSDAEPILQNEIQTRVRIAIIITVMVFCGASNDFLGTYIIFNYNI